jgi:hypothetical protein
MLCHGGDHHHSRFGRRSPWHDRQRLRFRVARSAAPAGLRGPQRPHSCPSACQEAFRSEHSGREPTRDFRILRAARPTHEHAEEEAGARFERTAQGTPILHGALAYLECRLQSAQEAGDHTIFIAEVEDVVVRQGEPLLFFRGKYRKIGEEVAD